MRYFAHLVSCNKANNKLQQSAFGFLSDESNRLVEDPETFISHVKGRIERLNVENPRCGPLHVSTNKDPLDQTKHLWIGNNLATLASFALYPVKEVY